MANNGGERYFDLQVNGYGGVDFNRDDLTSEHLETACRRLAEANVDGILATIITESVPTMVVRLANLARLIDSSPAVRRIVRGIHIEGPFLSPDDGYRGAHPLDAIRPADIDTMQQLIGAAGGHARLVTLAPEHDPGLRVTRMLADLGIVVSAGHCNPTLDRLSAAIDAGLTMFTHLGNGCPMMLPRHDNIIQRALSLSDRLMLCFIADGVHVPFHALGNYLRAAGVDRCIAATDAIAPAGLGTGCYTLSRWKLKIGDDMVARAPDGSHLVGSAITMPQTARNLADHCGLTADEVRKLTWDNPAQLA